ncbi:MAG TPA: alpha/beta fold hydrolase [Oculatellaceae cyanobacterium]
MSEIKAQRVELQATDGLTLVGYHFQAESPHAAILVCSATAVRQRYYFPFARWLCQQGFSVLTLDYRGIGESIDAPALKHSRARKQDWGELDMPAALAWLDNRYPTIAKHLVGHSAGGILFGLMPNFDRLASVIAIGCSTGYVRYIAMPDRFVAATLLSIYFPLASKFFGYVPAKKLGWGEDLPTGIAMQWAHWCSNPGYVSNSFGKDIHIHHYDEVKAPILILNMTDDPISSKKNVEDLQRLFPQAITSPTWIDPKEFKLAEVGHMGFFRPKNSVLWANVTNWLKDH